MTQGFAGTLFMENFAAARTPLASHHSTVRHLTQKPFGTRRDSDRHAFSRHLKKWPSYPALSVYPAICHCLYCRHSLHLVDFRKKITGFFFPVLPASFRPAKRGRDTFEGVPGHKSADPFHVRQHACRYQNDAARRKGLPGKRE